MDSSQNAYNEDTTALVERLDSLEKSLFRSGQSGLNSFQSWEKGQASQLTASSLVLNYRKRKITDIQQWARSDPLAVRLWDQHFLRIQTAKVDGHVWAWRKARVQWCDSFLLYNIVGVDGAVDGAIID